MSGKILVLGGTGPAGICLLRELLFRDHDVIAFARNPSKIPDDLKSNPKLEVVKGELTDREQLADAVSRSSAVLSLLGPNSLLNTDPSVYYNFYVLLFGLMREHQVRRIFAMSTISVWQPGDRFSLIRWLVVALVFVVAHYGWRTARAIARVFEEHAGGWIGLCIVLVAFLVVAMRNLGGRIERITRHMRVRLGRQGGLLNRGGRRWRGGSSMLWRMESRNGFERCLRSLLWVGEPSFSN
ncbi:hypothetical protein V2G26_005949 [Clonostachys chloroleuca]